MKDKVIEILKKLGLYSEGKQGEIEKALDELKIDEPTNAPTSSAFTSSIPTKEVMEQLAALAQQNKQLFEALAEEKRAREASQRTIAEQMKKEKEAKIVKTLDDAKKVGKITPAQEAHYKKLLENDYDTTVAIIEALPVNPASSKQDDGKKSNSQPSIMHFEQTGNKTIVDRIKELAQISEN